MGLFSNSFETIRKQVSALDGTASKNVPYFIRRAGRDARAPRMRSQGSSQPENHSTVAGVQLKDSAAVTNLPTLDAR